MPLQRIFFDAVDKCFKRKTTLLSQFRSTFGVSTLTTFYLFIFLQKYIQEIQPEHLFWTLHFLKSYPTNQEASMRWNCDPKTYRKWVWKVLSILFVTLNKVQYIQK
jgi:hypothetical protein